MKQQLEEELELGGGGGGEVVPPPPPRHHHHHHHHHEHHREPPAPRLERAAWSRQSFIDQMDTPRLKRASRHIAKLNMGDTKDDIHVCIMCLRAIMNNKVGHGLGVRGSSRRGGLPSLAGAWREAWW